MTLDFCSVAMWDILLFGDKESSSLGYQMDVFLLQSYMYIH